MKSTLPHSTPLLALTEVAVASLKGGSQPVIEGVNWELAKGDFHVVGALAGEGKSALVQTAAGILKPRRGDVTLFSTSLNGLTETEQTQLRVRLGLVQEGGGRLFPHLTVAGNLALPYCYHHDCSDAEAWNHLEPLLELLDLGPIAHQPPGMIPRPARARAGLGRALIMAPEILLLDNPLHGLDAQQSRWWLNFLSRLAAGNLPGLGQPALAVVTDNLRPWLAPDRNYAMVKAGRWLELGTREQLTATAEPALHDLLSGPDFKE
jgi:ABC-type transporter Mla maintaining outer membrane lipid asymmetry ATPase subunit MlaF